jgi:hypothetical protein
LTNVRPAKKSINSPRILGRLRQISIFAPACATFNSSSAVGQKPHLHRVHQRLVLLMLPHCCPISHCRMQPTCCTEACLLDDLLIQHPIRCLSCNILWETNPLTNLCVTGLGNQPRIPSFAYPSSNNLSTALHCNSHPGPSSKRRAAPVRYWNA